MRSGGSWLIHDAAIYRRAAALLVLIGALAAIASSNVLHDALLSALSAANEIIDRHPVLGAALFVVLAAASAMLAFVSSALVIPVAVFAWGGPATVGLLWLGWVLGGIATYSAGKFLGRPVVRWLAADEVLSRWESRLPADAPLWVIVLVQLALPSEIPGYVLGLLRYPLTRYAIALGLAELPYAIATVYLGASFVEGRSGLILVMGILISLSSLAALYALSRALASKNLASHANARELQRRSA